ncbi:MAG: methyltransferase type 11 [Anaerolineae bacterium]|nr:methyltransferase domain-containing protein [Chloroflexi bacterium CFX2]MCQ3945105.1 methyltransferase type 11 [Anaerolineae bacterium]GER79215.1 methyltransferase domain-containing protein [Candidatus Denitrolinea symbiosum]
MSQSSNEKRYIPALSFRWLTPLYDPLLKWVMREETFKRKLIQQANIQPHMKILDLGCGTGTLTVMLRRAHPEAEVTGLDGDPEVLEIAREKSRGLDVQWDEGLASSLPYPDSAFDRVVTSLVIHHLVTADKRRAFEEIYRVLKPRGELYILDFGAPHSSLTRFMTTYMRRLEETADNFDGLIPRFVTEAGFGGVKEAENFVTVFGPLSIIQAMKGA